MELKFEPNEEGKTTARVDKFYIINPAINNHNTVMPDLIRHPVLAWIPAFAGMT